MRVAPGAIIGFDMTAALALARAGQIDEFAVAEFLPAIEEAMVSTINSERREADGN